MSHLLWDPGIFLFSNFLTCHQLQALFLTQSGVNEVKLVFLLKKDGPPIFPALPVFDCGNLGRACSHCRMVTCFLSVWYCKPCYWISLSSVIWLCIVSLSVQTSLCASIQLKTHTVTDWVCCSLLAELMTLALELSYQQPE